MPIMPIMTPADAVPDVQTVANVSAFVQTLLPVIAGGFVAWALEQLKKNFSFSGRVGLIVICTIVAFLFTLFKFIVPAEIQMTIVTFLTSMMGTAVAVHQFYIRTVLKEDPPTLDVEKK